MPNKLVISSLLAAVAGFLDATYLTLENFLNKVPPCSLGSCEQVLTSPYAHVFGIPVALLGTVYYVTLVLLLVVYLTTQRKQLIQWFSRLTVVGFVASVWLVFVQLFLIHAICPYCLLSEILSTVLFVFGFYLSSNV